MQKSVFPQKIQRTLCITTKYMNNFKRNYLENYNDSEHAVKTKNAPFFMIFPNISFLHMVVDWSFKGGGVQIEAGSRKKFFSQDWLIFGTRGFSGTRNRLAQVPSFKKIFMTP